MQLFRVSVFFHDGLTLSAMEICVVRKLFCLFADRLDLHDRLYEKQKRREQNQRYYQRLKQDPERFRRVMKKIPVLDDQASPDAGTHRGPDPVPHRYGESEQRIVDGLWHQAADSDAASPQRPDSAHAVAAPRMESRRISGSEERGPDNGELSKCKIGGESSGDAP